MGLRINTNLPAVSALRNLKITEQKQTASMMRLSTGLRISTAGDDPSGLVVSNKMRAQVAGMKQAVENTRRDENLVQTADAALSEVEEMLNDIRQSVLFAMNAGGADLDQIAVEQDAVDKTLKAIDRIANNTRFGQRQLLNGASEHKAINASNEFRGINIEKLQYLDETVAQSYTVRVTAIASQAVVGGDLNGAALPAANVLTMAVSGTDGVLRITGSLGSETVAVGATITGAQVTSAVNQLQFNTGVYASAGSFYSHGFGTVEEISVEVAEGSIVGFGAGTRALDAGANIAGTVNGIVAAGSGTTLVVNTTALVAEFTMEHTGGAGVQVAAGTNYTYSINPNSGLRFQLNDSLSASSTETVGLRSLNTSALGIREQILPNTVNGNTVTIDGYLSSLAAAGSNSLTSNPTNALRIVDSSVRQLSDMRAALGSLAANVFQPNEGALEVAIESLRSAVSDVRDLDFAAETTEFTRSQIMFQAGVSVLAQANLIPQTVLQLLQ